MEKCNDAIMLAVEKELKAIIEKHKLDNYIIYISRVLAEEKDATSGIAPTLSMITSSNPNLFKVMVAQVKQDTEVYALQRALKSMLGKLGVDPEKLMKGLDKMETLKRPPVVTSMTMTKKRPLKKR
jgi:DNA repair ATPase RecN